MFPKSKIIVTSKTRKQANEVLEKITDEFMMNHGWGSDNLKREILRYKVAANDAEIIFRNGSWMKVVPASDNARGKRANIIVYDEFRMIDPVIIDTVLKPMLSAPRNPNYLNNSKYEHLKERNIEMYMSSAWFKDHWSYEKAKSFGAIFASSDKEYFICSLPYQLAIKENLLDIRQIEDKMSESDFNEISFYMEMCALFWGDADGAFFKASDISKRRKLKVPTYPYSIINNKTYKIDDLAANERRILSVDVALMASGKHKNDASAIMINRAMPTNSSYIANIVYLENREGLNTDELALVVRKLYDEYKCTDLVLDTMGQGLGVYDKLIQDIVDPETGVLYHALSCCNDKDMEARCKVPNAPKVIWSIKGNASFNTEICILLRTGFKTGKINLLIPHNDSEEALIEWKKSFSTKPMYEQIQHKMPYLQTDLLVNELINLEHEIRGTNIKIKEKTGMRKDRYSSLAYNYWVQCQLEREVLRKQKQKFDLADYASKFKKLNHRPNMY